MNFHVATAKDLESIATCHRMVFPASLTSKMGIHYLTKIFSWYISTDKTFLFFIQENDRVVGYCGGMVVDGTLAHGSASSMTQHTFNDALIALALRPWLLFHPEFLTRYPLFIKNIVTRLLNWFRKSEIRTTSRIIQPYTGLVVIGVHPDYQGKGYGSELLKEFEIQTIQRHVNRMTLTVKSDNAKAIKSYQKNGWSIYKKEGKSVAMEKKLN